MRRATAVTLSLLTLTLLAGAVPSHASGLDLRLGGFFPNANSNLFTDDHDLYGIDPKKDFTGVTGGIEYSAGIARNVELGFSIDGYDRQLHTSYRDFVNDNANGSEIRQTLKLNIVPVGVTLRFLFAHPGAAVVPYAGAGGDLFYWRYREYGDFIDFGDPTQPIVADSFVSDGWKVGFHVSGGLRLRLNHDVAAVAEGRYQYAPKVTMGDDFASNGPGLENKIDLSGWSATVGVHIRF